MHFDELRQQAGQANTVTVPASWAQGRTVFGGLSAALLTDGLSAPIESDRRLRYLEIGFIRPLQPDQPFRITTQPVSAGRTLAVQAGQIIQDETVRVTAQANYVHALPDKTVIEPFQPPELLPWDHGDCIRVKGAAAPAFTQYIDFRIAAGGAPFSGRGGEELAGWMRFENPPATLETAHLIALIDAWPPLVSAHYSRPVPMSSVNWQLHFADTVDGIPGTEFLGYRARINFFTDGYGSSSAEIWAPAGQLLAKSFQTFLVFG